MKKLIYLMFCLLITCSSIAQKIDMSIPESEVYKSPFLVGLHLYINYDMLRMSDEQKYIIDQIPTKRVSIDNNGDFHLTNAESVIFYGFQDMSEICKDTIDGHKTIYFTDDVYTKKDTITIETIFHLDYFPEDDMFFPDDRVYYEAYSIRGAIINGKKEGLWEKCRSLFIGYKYVEPKMIDENYKDGLLHGFRLCYDQYGKTVSSEFFFNGTGYCLFHHLDGTVAAQGPLVKGERQGDWKYYNQQGTMIRSEQYNAGLLDGTLIINDSYSVELYKTRFNKGTGQYREYQGDMITMEGEMINGQRIGQWSTATKIRYPDYSAAKKRGVIEERQDDVNYKENEAINNPKCILDYTYFNGKWVYVLVMHE